MTDKIISQEQLQSIFEYKDGEIFRKIKTGNSVKIGEKAGWHKHGGYMCVSVNAKSIYIHRVIFLMHYGYLPKYIDHIDGNPSNNKIENLRKATQSQNMANSNRTNKNKLKGTTFSKKQKKWVAAIMINYKRIHLGYFETELEAHNAYTKKADEIFKEFARHD